MLKLSIIIPVFNGSDILESGLQYLTDCLQKKQYDFEIIIVDDGSKDSIITRKIAEMNNATFIELGKNRGKGASVREGMINSSGDIRIFTDADIPYEFDSMENILTCLETGKVDIAVGDRTLEKSGYYNTVSFIRNFGSKILSLIIGRVVKTGLKDTQCGLKGFTAESVSSLFPKSRINGFAFDVELLYLACKYNYKIKRVQVKPRRTGKSSVRIIKHGFLMIVDLLRIKIYQIIKSY